MPPVGERPHEQLTGENGGARGAYAANLHQHLPLAFDRGVLRAGDVPLALDGAQLALHEIETRVFAFEFLAKAGSDRQALGRAQRGEVDPSRSERRLDATDALGEQEPLDPIDMSRALPDQALPFAMRAAGIFLLDARHADDDSDVFVAAIDGDERAQQHQDLDAVVRQPAAAGILSRADTQPLR